MCGVTYAGGSANLFHAEFLSLIKHQQHQGLEQGDLQLLLTLQDKMVIVSAVQIFSQAVSLLSRCTESSPL